MYDKAKLRGLYRKESVEGNLWKGYKGIYRKEDRGITYNMWDR